MLVQLKSQLTLACICFVTHRTVFQLGLEEYISSISRGISMPSTQLYGPF